jgi:hypothetical protein
LIGDVIRSVYVKYEKDKNYKIYISRMWLKYENSIYGDTRI